MGLLGMVVSFGLLIFLAYRGWSVLIMAPAAALLAALASGEPLLANWTQTFMGSAAGFFAQFFPIFLLGALFGKLMEDTGSIAAISDYFTRRLGAERAILAVVVAGAIVTYGGVNLFVAFFFIAPMAQALFQAANIPKALMPATIWLGAATFTFSALPGSPAVQNAIPMPHFGTTPFAAPGLGLIATAVMACLGLLWLRHAEVAARRGGQGYVATAGAEADAVRIRELASTREFDPAEIERGAMAEAIPPAWSAFLPLGVVVVVNFAMSLLILPRLDFPFLAEPEWGSTSVAAVGGLWSVMVALIVAILVLLAVNGRRLPSLRDTMDAGLNASVLPIVTVGSLAGFGAVLASLPAASIISQAILSLPGDPLVPLAVSTSLLAGMTGSASAALTIVLDALGPTYAQMAELRGVSPDLLHRVAAISSGTLDTLPHSGALITLLSVCGVTHKESYRHIVMAGILPSLAALIVVMVLGGLFGSF